MKITNKILLPGTDRQALIFLKTVEIKNKSVLILSAASNVIAEVFHGEGAKEIYLITDNEDSLIEARLILSGIKEINVRLMDYGNTDFKQEKFDIVYTQGSTGTSQRNKIIKEIKRILKPGGYFCVGEIVTLKEAPPQFVKDTWQNNNLSPLFNKEFKEFYLSMGFELTIEQDLSGTLKDFYILTKKLLSESSRNFSDEETKSLKKMIKMYTHEANAYLELGGDKYIGYVMLIMRKV